MVVGGERAEAQVLRVPGGQEAGAAVPDLRSRGSAPGRGWSAASLSYLPGRGRAKAVILGAAPTLLPLFSRNLRSQSREEARRGRPVGSGNLESRFPRRGGSGAEVGPPRDVVCTCSRSAPFKPKPAVGPPLSRSSGE